MKRFFWVLDEAKRGEAEGGEGDGEGKSRPVGRGRRAAPTCPPDGGAHVRS